MKFLLLLLIICLSGCQGVSTWYHARYPTTEDLWQRKQIEDKQRAEEWAKEEAAVKRDAVIIQNESIVHTVKIQTVNGISQRSKAIERAQQLEIIERSSKIELSDLELKKEVEYTNIIICNTLKNIKYLFSAMVRERANPSGFFYKSTLHDLGTEIQDSQDELNVYKATYYNLTHKNFSSTQCAQIELLQNEYRKTLAEIEEKDIQLKEILLNKFIIYVVVYLCNDLETIPEIYHGEIQDNQELLTILRNQLQDAKLKEGKSYIDTLSTKCVNVEQFITKLTETQKRNPGLPKSSSDTFGSWLKLELIKSGWKETG